MTAAIADLRSRIIRLPLSRPWGPDVRVLHVIAVDVLLDDGSVGHGFSWTPTIGSRAVSSLIDHDIREAAVGRAAEPAAVWDALWAHLHELGGGGATTIALAGLDLALWDARTRRDGVSLVEALGERRASVPVYGSGVNLHYPLADLEDQARRWVRSGYAAVKMKVGSASLVDDVERVGAVRRIIGPDRLLRVDANQRWDLGRATEAIRELAAFDLDWVEEPLRADDLEGHRLLRSRVDVPIALGENLHTGYRVGDFLRAGACDVVQPNVVRVGGITPFLRIAESVDSAGARIAPHLLPEISGQLALALGTETSVEEVEGAGLAALGALAAPPPVVIDAGRLRRSPDAEPGLGLRFRAAIPSDDPIRV